MLVVLHGPRDHAAASRLAAAARAFQPRVFADDEAPSEAPAESEAAAVGPDTVRLLIAPDEETFRRAAGDRLPDWGLAVAFPGSAEIVVRSPRLVSSPAREPERVLAHELAHVYVGLYLREARSEAPRWFQEGLASLLAGEWGWSERADLALALVTGRPLGLERLDAAFPASRPAAELAYLESLSAVAYRRGLSGDRGLRVLLRNLRATGDFDRALRRTYGFTYGELQQRWSETVSRRYGWAAAAASAWTAWTPAALAVVLFVLLRRARYRQRLAEMERGERDAEAAGEQVGEPGAAEPERPAPP